MGLSTDEMQEMRARIVEVLRTVFDPEIPVNIYELGLVYNIDIADTGAVEVKMTLTSPNCPVAESLPQEVEQNVMAAEGVTDARIQVVWEPPWTPEMMTEEAKLELNMM